jgi:periplasmic divalent cation tolerance protein
MRDPIVVLCTAGSNEEALGIAKALVDERLAACVNVLPAVQSIYRWQGKIETAEEVLMVIKTTRERFEALKTRIGELHTYDTPEIIALPIVDAVERYLVWLCDQV